MTISIIETRVTSIALFFCCLLLASCSDDSSNELSNKIGTKEQGEQLKVNSVHTGNGLKLFLDFEENMSENEFIELRYAYLQRGLLKACSSTETSVDKDGVKRTSHPEGNFCYDLAMNKSSVSMNLLPKFVDKQLKEILLVQNLDAISNGELNSNVILQLYSSKYGKGKVQNFVKEIIVGFSDKEYEKISQRHWLKENKIIVFQKPLAGFDYGTDISLQSQYGGIIYCSSEYFAQINQFKDFNVKNDSVKTKSLIQNTQRDI